MKGGRFITHLRRLRDCRGALANFFAQGLLTLGPKLGPILWQLPPTMKFDAALLESFFALLPRDTAAASALAAEHDAKMNGKAAFEVDRKRPMRHAIEVRHESFRDAAFITLLREHNVGLVVADTAGRYPLMDDVTADFVYARLHGDAELYVSGYTDAALEMWAAKCRAWAAGEDAPDARLAGPPAKRAKGRDVYAYFDNDAKVRSPFDAGGLAARLGAAAAAPTAHVDLEQVDGEARLSWPVPLRPAATKPAATKHAAKKPAAKKPAATKHGKRPARRSRPIA